MSGIDGLMMCEEHKSPMIEIRGNMECVIDYLNSIAGTHRINSIEKNHAGVTSLVFDSSAIIPLYCPHCGQPEHCELDKNIVGMFLVALCYEPATKDLPEAVLLFLSDHPENEAKSGDFIPLHLDSVRNSEYTEYYEE